MTFDHHKNFESRGAEKHTEHRTLGNFHADIANRSSDNAHVQAMRESKGVVPLVFGHPVIHDPSSPKGDAAASPSAANHHRHDSHAKSTPSDSGVGSKTQAWENARRGTAGTDSVAPPEPSDLRNRIGNSRVLTWGEYHGDYKDGPERFKNSLPALKQAGFNKVAMEGLREDRQKLINKWQSADKNSDKEKGYEGQIRHYLDKAVHEGKQSTDNTMEQLKQVKDVKMKVVCMEPNGGKITEKGDGVPKDRDGNWTRVVNRNLTPNSKIVVFAGAPHFAHYGKHDPLGRSFADRMSDHHKVTDMTAPSVYGAWERQ